MKIPKLVRNPNLRKWFATAAAVVLLATAAGCSESEPKPDYDSKAADCESEILDYDNEIDAADAEAQSLTEKIRGNLAAPGSFLGSLSTCYGIEGLKSEGIVQIVRFNDGRYYSVTPVEGGRYLFLLYSDGENLCNDESFYVVDGYLTSGFADRDEFEDVEPGMSREEILLKDPNAYVSENFSYHRFSDKSVLEIEYDADKNIVLDSFCYYPEDHKGEPYMESVVDYLLPQDLALIS